jgi:hypothetical protein
VISAESFIDVEAISSEFGGIENDGIETLALVSELIESSKAVLLTETECW